MSSSICHSSRFCLQGEADLDDNSSMPVERVRMAAGRAIRDGIARLADVAPNELVVLSEESDWGLVGGDLRDAMASETREIVAPASRPVP